MNMFYAVQVGSIQWSSNTLPDEQYYIPMHNPAESPHPQAPHKTSSTTSSQQHRDKQSVVVSWLQMVRPYNSKSQLKSSVFHGYFNLCYVMSIFFICVYPLRKFITKGIFCEEEVLKMLETNLKWDVISLVVFVVIGAGLMMIPARVFNRYVQAVVLVGYLAVGHTIVRHNRMYYSDRAFIVFLSWGFALKLYSYFNSTETNHTLARKLRFFFMPRMVFDGFDEEKLPERQIIWDYLVKKLLLNFLCLFANCVIVVEFIDPVVANKERMTFIELWFNLIPPVFYLNLCMFYFVFENVFSPLAELTKMRNRKFFEDWWNANSFFEMIEKFCSTIDYFLSHHISQVLTSNANLKPYLQQIKVFTFMSISQIITLQIFDKRLKLLSLFIFALINTVTVLIGRKHLGNYLVHGLMMAAFPLAVALDLKFGLFT